MRATHWIIFLSIIVLTVTGYYIYSPFLTSKASHQFVMATMRSIHEITGYVFIAALIIRLYWFFAGNKWARLGQFLPIGRRRARDFKDQLAYYLFLRREPPLAIGHNPLAGLTYLVVFGIMAAEVLTGLALIQHVNPNKTLGYFINWLPHLISWRYIRLIHFVIMFMLWGFFVHHVYSAVLIGLEERSELVKSIFTGYKVFQGRKLKEDERRDRELV